MATPKITVKRGDTFKLDIQLTDPNDSDVPMDITGWVITSQIRHQQDFVSDLEITITDASVGEFTISASNEVTELWKPLKHECDIQFKFLDESVLSSETFLVQVEKDVSYV